MPPPKRGQPHNLIVALSSARDLLLRAKQLFVGATVRCLPHVSPRVRLVRPSSNTGTQQRTSINTINSTNSSSIDTRSSRSSARLPALPFASGRYPNPSRELRGLRMTIKAPLPHAFVGVDQVSRIDAVGLVHIDPCEDFGTWLPGRPHEAWRYAYPRRVSCRCPESSMVCGLPGYTGAERRGRPVHGTSAVHRERAARCNVPSIPRKLGVSFIRILNKFLVGPMPSVPAPPYRSPNQPPRDRSPRDNDLPKVPSISPIRSRL